jgi:hypothetical protein
MDSDSTPAALETDPRFPSGPWTGYFLQKLLPGRHLMEMQLHFQAGVMQGGGRDRVGAFVVEGNYELTGGRCHWTKTYVGRHSVFYSGYNEGKGIWGTWELPNEPPANAKGGFHIWPEGLGDGELPFLAEEADLPLELVT